ncbi:hypothetical protein HP439_10185 [Sphingobacterium shayense]|uniref:hypothetical protein n=1 Tax=Sphingobacterium shayense TaxID=626343 RepID=UPI0015559EB6|nr:hypothetical protein [Sphingobacterium shayense]NQD71087.1 hypothetical protein [Sphingobacterium shayense]
MRNNFFLGLVVGLCAPIVAFGLTEYSLIGSDILPRQPLFLYALAAGINLLLVRVFYRNQPPRDKIAKGILSVTFLAMLVFLYVYKIDM